MSVDVHTHLYLPRYTALLRERKVLPFVREIEPGVEKYYLLPGEDEAGGAGGRPFNVTYYDINQKIQAMDSNNIAASVISLANPWLDFMDKNEAIDWATQLNDDMEQMCVDSNGRLYGFGVIPLQEPRAAVQEVHRLKELPHMRGIIMGTLAAGKGLDDPALEPVWEALQATGQTAFIHPHYGIGKEHMGGFGHALSLALGFPFETTTAVARLVCSGALEKYPDLRLLLAHSGGTLPFLAGRLDSCVSKDHSMQRLPQKPSAYLSKLYYDALSYDARSIRAAIDLCGEDSLMFGTDFPFFGHDTTMAWGAVESLGGEVVEKIRYKNAEKILNVKVPPAEKKEEKE